MCMNINILVALWFMALGVILYYVAHERDFTKAEKRFFIVLTLLIVGLPTMSIIYMRM